MARNFNGTSDLINIDGACINPNFSTTAFSVAGWLNGAAQINKYLYSEGSSTTTPFWGLATQNGGTGAKLAFVSSATTFLTATTATVADSTPHHVGVTLDGAGNWVVYIDGIADRNSSTTRGSLTLARATIGALRRSTTGNWFAGKLWDWASWSRKLAATEMASLAGGLPASFLGPAHYWPLWGVDSPEVDIGMRPAVGGTLTGTTFAAGARVGCDLLTVAD